MDRPEQCRCGRQPRLEYILDYQAIFRGVGIKTRWRVVCDHCGEGMCNIRGSKTRAGALSDWSQRMRTVDELAAEFGVDPKHFILKVHGTDSREEMPFVERTLQND